MRNIFKKFYNDRSGNFAMIFALSLFPVMLGIGLAVDYTRGSSDKGNAQDAVDAATLATAKNMVGMSDEEIEAFFKKFLQANVSSVEYSRMSNIAIVPNRAASKLDVTLDSYTPTTVGMLAGKDRLSYKLAAEVKIGLGDLEVAMVLDNTYSMSADGKIAALKTSATSFVESLFDIDNGAGKLKISLVPFNQYVNVGMTNRNADWIDVADDYSEVGNVYIKVEDSCVDVTGDNDGIKYETEHCDWVPTGETYNKHYVWNGCVGSRGPTLNLHDSGYAANKVPGILFRDYKAERDCPNELIPLTQNKSTLLTKVGEMDVNGRTYIPAGIMWGWRALSASAPYSEGSAASSDQVQKVMVLMTDGDNQATVDFSTGRHDDTNNIDDANTMTTTACENAKDAGITIYAITFGSDIAPATKTLLQNCASNIEYYFDATTADDLDDSFVEIMKKIGQIRIAS